MVAASAGPASASEWRVPTEAGPPQAARTDAFHYARAHPGAAPAGANDFACVPTGEHPEPVILVHGTDSSAYDDWAALSPMLAADGWCVFALDYGGAAEAESGTSGSLGDAPPGARSFGTEDLYDSVDQLAEFTRRVLAATGADRVNYVGYSQGATVSRYYVNERGGAAHTDRWVGLASPTYGGTMYGIVDLLNALPGGLDLAEQLTSRAVRQQMRGSPFLTELNAGGDTVPGVHYTTVGSRYDEMIQPYTDIALRDPGATNVLVQDACPADASGHFLAPYDPYALDLVRTALDPDAEPHGECVPVPLGTGILRVILDSNSS
ncbi:alpha/beta fold hydrolase [Rhodococcus sp. HNM0569]|uniref:esterase/lipase family protein n=1 Tax=Rhodococcus sp. HNM0569 TaxID=2716340 RepID=UPI003211DC2A